jgi:hypothetical protein
LALIDLNRVEFQQPDRSHAFLKRLTLLSGVVALVASGYLIRDTRLTEKLQFYADEIWSSSASTTSASRQTDELETTDKVGVVPIQANSLFEGGGKGPRADHFLTVANSPQRASVILASMSPVATDNAAPAPAAPYRDYVAVSRGKKGNLWRPGDPFDGEIEVAKASDDSIPGPGRIASNRATAGVFFASALGANSLENHKPCGLPPRRRSRADRIIFSTGARDPGYHSLGGVSRPSSATANVSAWPSPSISRLARAAEGQIADESS